MLYSMTELQTGQESRHLIQAVVLPSSWIHSYNTSGTGYKVLPQTVCILKDPSSEQRSLYIPGACYGACSLGNHQDRGNLENTSFLWKSW